MADDNRGGERVPAFLRVRLKYPDVDTFVEKYSTNLSRGGIFIASRTPKPVGTTLRFELTLQDSSRLIRGEGVVTWVKEFDERQPLKAHGMGVRFSKLDPESKALVDRMLAFKERARARGELPRESTNPGFSVPGLSAPVMAMSSAETAAAVDESARAAPAGGAVATPPPPLRRAPPTPPPAIATDPSPAPRGKRVPAEPVAARPDGGSGAGVAAVRTLRDSLDDALARPATAADDARASADRALDALLAEAHLRDGVDAAAARGVVTGRSLDALVAELESLSVPAAVETPADPATALAALLGMPPPYRRRQGGAPGAAHSRSPVDEFAEAPSTLVTPAAVQAAVLGGAEPAAIVIEADEPEPPPRRSAGGSRSGDDDVDSALDKLFGD